MKKILILGLIVGCVGIFAAHAELTEAQEAEQVVTVAETDVTEPVKKVEQKQLEVARETQSDEFILEDLEPGPAPEEPDAELEPVPIEYFMGQ